MGVTASLGQARLSVAPGSEATVELRVRNVGAVVDLVTVEVIGSAASWATVTPKQLSLFPGTDQVVRVDFRPPMTADGPAGEVPFGLRVRSQEDPEGSVVEEGVIDVAAFLAVGAELVPRSSRGRKHAEHELSVHNRGTRPVQATISANDPDGHLLFALDPPALVVPPNSASFVKVRVRPAKTFRKGPPLTRMFEVAVSEGDQLLAVAAGMMVQEETIPKWLRRALLWALVALALLVVLWFAIAKPVVESAAKEAAREEVTPPTIGAGGGGGGGAGKKDDKKAAEDAEAGGGADVATSTAGAGAGTTIDGRLFLTEKGTTAYEVPADSILQVTDIVLQNPGGDTGSLHIRRSGTPLLVVELGNFRDLDYHFVAPIVFTAGQTLELAADCTSPGCTPGAYFAGYLVKG